MTTAAEANRNLVESIYSHYDFLFSGNGLEQQEIKQVRNVQ